MATYTDPLRDKVKNTTADGTVSAHPSYAATKNANPVFSESLVYGVLDQASADYDSAASRIVGHLGNFSGVNMDSLRPRESGIRGVAAALHLKHHRVGYLTLVRDHGISMCDH